MQWVYNLINYFILLITLSLPFMSGQFKWGRKVFKRFYFDNNIEHLQQYIFEKMGEMYWKCKYLNDSKYIFFKNPQY